MTFVSTAEHVARAIDAQVVSEIDERIARDANAPEKWDQLWAAEGEETWRGEALSEVYDRIVQLMPKGSNVVDLGGGIGILARALKDAGCDPIVYDASPEAVKTCQRAGVRAIAQDLGELLSTSEFEHVRASGAVVVSTECLEHLSESVRFRVLQYASQEGRAFFSVPNDRLGPDEEPQHTIKFTAVSFKKLLRQFWTDVRIEVVGPNDAFLLAVCGFPKAFTLSLTLPVRNEAPDIARVLASFRGCCDEIVVGIDPRSDDGTREIVAKYADVVFDLTELRGPPGDEVKSENGFHFAHARNQCLDKCTSDWVFMTEGHERLLTGQDELLALHELEAYVQGVYVVRTGDRQQWGFPWLTKRAANFRYYRSTHNALDLRDQEDKFIALPKVKTRHERDHKQELARRGQRKVQNRITLMEDWLHNQNESSLFYLGSEWREYDEEKAMRYMREFIVRNRSNGPMRYQTRLQLAKLYTRAAEAAEMKGDMARVNACYSEARQLLIEATGDDWCRTEHWWWLGDLAMVRHAYEEAIQFYRYAATRMGKPPFTLFWIDLATYEYLPAQRLAAAFGELGNADESLYWAKQVLEHLPPDMPEAFFEEARSNIALLEEAIAARLTASP